MLKGIIQVIQNVSINLGIYPHIFFLPYPNPFKILEFKELIKGLNNGNQKGVFLDIGCGHGFQTMILGKMCNRAIGIDISEKEINFARALSEKLKGRIHSEFYCTRLEKAGFHEEEFNKIFSFCVIEHIPNYEEVLSEAYRILKNGGEMLLTLDNLELIDDPGLLKRHKNEHFVQKYFKPQEIKLQLEDIGFKDVVCYPLFKSPYAKKLFIKGIENKFRFRYRRLSSILLYFRLCYHEWRHADRTKGIFLVVKCRK